MMLHAGGYSVLLSASIGYLQKERNKWDFLKVEEKGVRKSEHTVFSIGFSPYNEEYNIHFVESGLDIFNIEGKRLNFIPTKPGGVVTDALKLGDFIFIAVSEQLVRYSLKTEVTEPAKLEVGMSSTLVITTVGGKIVTGGKRVVNVWDPKALKYLGSFSSTQLENISHLKALGNDRVVISCSFSNIVLIVSLRAILGEASREGETVLIEDTHSIRFAVEDSVSSIDVCGDRILVTSDSSSMTLFNSQGEQLIHIPHSPLPPQSDKKKGIWSHLANCLPAFIAFQAEEYGIDASFLEESQSSQGQKVSCSASLIDENHALLVTPESIQVWDLVTPRKLQEVSILSIGVDRVVSIVDLPLGPEVTRKMLETFANLIHESGDVPKAVAEVIVKFI